ncbi:MAG: hypothetical protein V4447_04375 [Pseudomonadota bacterium]
MKSALLDLLKNNALSEDIKQIYYDFKYLKFFDDYGASCFAMAGLLCKLLNEKGYSARVQGCHSLIQKPGFDFHLGGEGFAKKEQIDGHVICIVDEAYLIDFGLGNVRKYFDELFFRCIACDLTPQENLLATLELESGMHVEWRTDWISPQIEVELRLQVPYIQQLLVVYHRYQKNRIAHLIQKNMKLKKTKNERNNDGLFSL